MSTKKPKKRKLRKWTKVVLVLVNVLLAAVILTGALYGIYKSYYNKMDYQETVTRTEFARGMRRVLEGDMREVMHAEHVYNILLIGQDSRVQGEVGRTDAMILISINTQTEEIIMTSLMRDSFVYIPGIGAERLNAAFMNGGAELLYETIETNFHIRIDNYVMIDFYAFMEVVDALGGVEMTVNEGEVENMKYYMKELNRLLGNPQGHDVIEEAGTYNLNGIQTLAYARCRYVDTERERTHRQRKVLEAIFEKLKASDLTEWKHVLDVVLPYVTTDVDEDTMLSLLVSMPTEYKDYTLVQHTMPYKGTYERFWPDEERNVLSIDIETNSYYMIRDIYGVDLMAALEEDTAEEETFEEEETEE